MHNDAQRVLLRGEWGFRGENTGSILSQPSVCYRSRASANGLTKVGLVLSSSLEGPQPAGLRDERNGQLHLVLCQPGIFICRMFCLGPRHKYMVTWQIHGLGDWGVKLKATAPQSPLGGGRKNGLTDQTRLIDPWVVMPDYANKKKG